MVIDYVSKLLFPASFQQKLFDCHITMDVHCIYEVCMLCVCCKYNSLKSGDDFLTNLGKDNKSHLSLF